MFGQQTLTVSQQFALCYAIGLAMLDGNTSFVTSNFATCDLTFTGQKERHRASMCRSLEHSFVSTFDCYRLKDLPTLRAFFIALACVAEDSETEPWVSLGA